MDKAALAQIPASAPLVVYLHGLEGTKGRLVTMIKNALPDVAPQAEAFLDKILEEGFDGRKIRGLAKEGPVFLVFTEVPKPGADVPKMALVLGVTKYADFRDNILKDDEKKGLKKDNNGVESVTLENGEAAYFLDKTNYAVVGHDKDVVASFAKKQAGLDTKMSKVLSDRLQTGDVSVYMAMDAFNKEYGDQIKQGKQAIEEILKAGGEGLGKAEQSILELAKNAVGPVFQAIEDSQGLLVTFEFRPTGLVFHAQTELRTGSVTSKNLKDFKPSAFAELGKLPAGQMSYTAIQTGPALFKALGGLMFGVVHDPDSKEAKDIQAAFDMLVKAKPSERFDASSLPPSGVQVLNYADPEKAIAGTLKLLGALESGNTFQPGMLKSKPVIKEKAQKYQNFDLTSIQLTWDLDKMVDQMAKDLPADARKELGEGMKKVMGEGMHLWIGTDGKAVLQVYGKDWTSAQKALDQYFKGEGTIGADATFKDARKELPAEATVLSLVDMVKFLAVYVDVLKPLLAQIPLPVPIPPNYPAMPAKGKAGYIGVAVALQPERGTFDFFISTTAVNQVYKSFIAPFRGF
jgi:hypothetical protein